MGISPNYSRSLYTARAIEKTIYDIHKKFPSEKIKKAIFDASVESRYHGVPRNYYIANGMHINFSLNNCKNTTSITCDDIVSYIEDANCNLLYLLGNDQNSKNRYAEKDIGFSDKANVKTISEDKKYIENSVPSASSNPYYAVLVTLLGAYQGLKMAKDGVAAPVNDDTLIESAEKAKQTFEASDNPYRKILNDIDPEPDEPKLGERFWDAIAKTPPSTEPRLYQKINKVNSVAQAGGIGT